MDWLGDWLKSVIMVVLFAAFVDLILPGKALERYARLVLSLLILLTLLSPIITLITDPPENQLAMELERQEKGLPEEIQLEHIMAQAEKLKDTQQSQSLQWAGNELAKVMKEEIAAETGEAVQEVKVVLAAVAGQGKEYAGAAIRSVDVKLAGDEPANAEAGEDDDRPIGVTPVDSVQVNVDSMAEEQVGKEAAKENAETVSKAEEARAEPVRDYISRRWDLEPELITIYTPGQDQDNKL
ncbi:stage III sporulation protein AF [Paenibacillus lautus]|jgi:stage III sporulation protein AF|uniref:Stage III sporulation protein AF n=1 Tax=Paenibacillus lautus TaxID=1401 RepID=A0A385TLB6_PAELA|nr:stage III sporulation protein AF [Paenibacillus lautus]AYB45280.1 stage III sporulation protein AF [Paenibacillus lautus]MBY0160343.1 stage III sporulation protein AF [Cytobacillus firmus]MCI1775358.1 stage III sporulation protein AF [Paenibacillus lautus]VTR55081.1 stage III sporulation protein AF [Actinobacillus pleuropneumoniae]